MFGFNRPSFEHARTVGRSGLIGSVIASALFAASALAQYKWVAPDGTVTYGDRPPIAEVKASRVGGTNDAVGANTNLPYALKAPTDKYPVFLFTTTDCKPCDQMRSHLSKRGVPFSEKLIKSQADLQAMEKLGFSDPSFPLMTVGKQKQSGFEAGAIDALLDNAGYPKTSLLPAGFRNGGNDAPTSKADTARADGGKADSGKPDGGKGNAGKAGDLAKNDANGAGAAQPGETPRQAARRRQQQAAAAQSNDTPATRSDNNPSGLRF